MLLLLTSGIAGNYTATALAVDHPVVGASEIEIENPIKAKSIQALFEAIIGIVLVFAVPIIVFFIIFAGFKYVTAQGNAEAISEANRMLLYALIGGLLILGANVLITVIQGTVDSITGS